MKGEAVGRRQKESGNQPNATSMLLCVCVSVGVNACATGEGEGGDSAQQGG